MSNFYDSLGQDLAPMMGYPPLDQTPPYGPERPPPMPPPQQLPPGSQGSAGFSGFPTPPPMSGAQPAYGDDPFNKAVGQTANVDQMFTPSAMANTPPTGARPQPPMPPVPGVGATAPAPVNGGGPPGASQAGNGGPPMPPPMMPNPNPGGVPFGRSTDYASAMGIAPTADDRMKSLMGGLGKGLTAAAGNSNKAGAVFSRGAGGAITGNLAEGDAQQKTNAALAQQYFNNTSTAFKDFQQQRSTDSLEIYRQAMADWRNHQIQTGAPGSKAFLNTPDGKLHLAETEAQAQYATDMKKVEMLKDKFPGPILQQMIQKAETDKQANLQAGYKKYGVDPEAAAEAQTRGLDIPKPFSAVKNGQWYVGKDGAPKKKTAGSNDFAPGDQVKWLNTFDGNKLDPSQMPAGVLYEKGGKVYTRNGTPPLGTAGQSAAPPPVDAMADPEVAYGGGGTQ